MISGVLARMISSGAVKGRFVVIILVRISLHSTVYALPFHITDIVMETFNSSSGEVKPCLYLYE